MADLISKKDIEKISLDILRSSKSLDQFPTPVDKIIQFTELNYDKYTDVSALHTDYLYSASNALIRGLKKVRGVFDFKERTIYLDLSQKEPKKNFVKLHEVGHGVLPWQVGIHNILADDDNTLSDTANDEFEQEANYFASVTLFQHDRFFDEMNKLPLGIDSTMVIAKQFGASVHATLRRYVEQSGKRCALIVLENLGGKSGRPICSLKEIFYSSKYRKAFGEILIANPLKNTLPFVREFYQQRRLKMDGLVELESSSGVTTLNYHLFNNSYNSFIFLFPKGEKQRSSTKIIVTDSMVL